MKQVDIKLSKIVPKLQILPDEGDTTFHTPKARKRLSLLNSLGAAILDFMMSVRCPIVSHKKSH